MLGRSFYLLETYPGRWGNGTLWVEAPVNLTAIDGSPFRNLNDGVTPVVITGNDFNSGHSAKAAVVNTPNAAPKPNAEG